MTTQPCVEAVDDAVAGNGAHPGPDLPIPAAIIATTTPSGEATVGDCAVGTVLTCHLAGTGPFVVLARHGHGVEVFGDGRTTELPDHTRAVPVLAPAERDAALAAAVAHLAAVLGQERHRHANAQARHQRGLDDIRDYAIEHHEKGDICRPGLDAFLSAFDLTPYQQRVRVTYSITGSYEVIGTTEAAEDDARGYLRPDLDSLDDVVDDSHTHDVTIQDVTAL